jgi:hypothetical protein
VTRRAFGPAYYCGVALATAALFVLVVPFGPWPLRVPFSYEEDGLVLTVLVKAVAEDGLLHFTRLGAPFGADFVDWGFGGWLIFLVTTPLVALLGSAGAALNAYWLLTVAAAGVSAAWVFRRLAVPARVAFVFGVLYALLPGTFYRHVGHIALAALFVPPLCLLCLRVAGRHPESFDRGERWITLGACVLQGLNMIYSAFFAFLLLAASLPIGWLRTRRPALARAGVLGLPPRGGRRHSPRPHRLYWTRHGGTSGWPTKPSPTRIVQAQAAPPPAPDRRSSPGVPRGRRAGRAALPRREREPLRPAGSPWEASAC